MYDPPVALTATTSMCNTAVITMYAHVVVCIGGDCGSKEEKKKAGGGVAVTVHLNHSE